MAKTLLITLSTVLLLTGCSSTPLFSPSPYSGPRVRDGNGNINTAIKNTHQPANALPAGQPLSQPLTSSEVIPANPLNNETSNMPPINKNNAEPVFSVPAPGAYIPSNNTPPPAPASSSTPQPTSYIPSTAVNNTNSTIAATTSAANTAVQSASSTSSSGGSAARTLLADAQQAVANNQLDKAASSLERAVRLEPRNASMWYNLAQVRLHQGQYAQAETLAQKSIGFAGNNSDIVKKSWLIISLSKQAQGDAAGAEAAKKKSL